MGRRNLIFGQFRETTMPQCATLGRGLLCFRTTSCRDRDTAAGLVQAKDPSCHRTVLTLRCSDSKRDA